jgi:hypothetical protein
MPAYDNCEPQIITALQKEGWRILNKPYVIRGDQHNALADFNMQRGVNGRSEQIIVLEVKCFNNPKTDMQELYTAVGQYGFYQEALLREQIFHPLYLAVPLEAYKRLTQDANIKSLLIRFAIKLVVIDTDQEEVVQWIT